jgi:ABC-type sugar transport system ATPase subunit
MLTEKAMSMKPQATPAALELSDVGMRFGAVEVLTGVDFTVKAGSIHALVGHNGAGKSTMMKISLGVYAPTEGRVAIGGTDLVSASPSEARRLGLGMVLQEKSLIATLTGLDNLYLNDEKTGFLTYVRRRAERVDAMQLCERLGIAPEVLNKRVMHMTAVERQMVEIAKALRLAQTILILDEPTAPLSHQEIEALFAVLRRVAALGTGIVLITHHLAEVFQISDEVTCLREGKVVLHASTSEVDMGQVVSAMLGKALESEGENSAAGPRVPADAAILFETERLGVGTKLNDISLDVRAGEIVGIAGLAGSGRSTLLKTIFGEIRPTEGRMSLRAQPYRATSCAAAIRSRVYLIPESRADYGLVLTQPIVHNMVLSILTRVSSFIVVRASKSRAVANQFMTALRIRARAPEQIVGELSGGNQQKVVLAKALAADAELLLLDEPTFGVDIGAAGDLIALIRERAQAGSGALWATSDLKEMLQVSDRIAVLVDGGIRTIIERGSPRFTEPSIIELMQRQTAAPPEAEKARR